MLKIEELKNQKLTKHGNFESGRHQTNENQRIKKYLGRKRNLYETKQQSINLIKRINTWTVPRLRYSGQFLKWMREEFQEMDKKQNKTRTLMMMHNLLHSRDDMDRLYVSRKEGGRRLASIEDSRYIDKTFRILHKKDQRKTYYSDQKQHK